MRTREGHGHGVHGCFSACGAVWWCRCVDCEAAFSAASHTLSDGAEPAGRSLSMVAPLAGCGRQELMTWPHRRAHVAGHDAPARLLPWQRRPSPLALAPWWWGGHV